MKQYQPLYLKYRPQKLSELVGQEVVKRTLTNAIKYNKIVHAYLFCGPRGTGKTSTARILAKSLNCESGVTTEPCDKCVSCKSIIVGNSLDVIEIDAASHRKVEDAEDLINRVSLGTYGSRYKIYIIDEVHMLTDHAFNALLKTLEEPPKNVIFILATTEEYKVIPTIISRCQKLDFKTVSREDTEQKMKDISSKENINIDKAIIDFISKRSYGCLRDAVSILDQISVLQHNDNPINSKEVFELFGTVDRISLFKLMEALLSFERKTAVDLAEELLKSGKDISELFKAMLELIIDLAKAKINPEFKKIISNELDNDLKVLDKISKNHLLKIIDKLQDSQSKLRFALSQELQFMVEMMSMMDEDFLISTTELKERIEKLEGKTSNKTLEPENLEIQTPQNLPPEARLAKGGKISELPIPTISEPQNLDSLWQKAVSLIESNPTRALLNQSESYIINLTNDILEVGISKDMFLPRLEDLKKKEIILKAIKLASGIEPTRIKFQVIPRVRESQTVSKGIIEEKNNHPATSYKQQTTTYESIATEDEFTRTVKDLLGARQIE